MRPRLLKTSFVAAAFAATALAGPGAATAAVSWCGNDRLATDRVPEAVGGHQTHVVYAIPSDGADRFGDVASAIATDVAAIDAWWRREDPARAPRFDLFAFPGCAPGFGQLDISLVRLPQPASAYHAYDGRLQRVATDLAAAGFANPFKKYLVYYDGVVDPANVCGTAYRLGEQGGRWAVAAVWVQAIPGLPGCGTLGLEDYLAVTATHELLHSFGAVPTGAPHVCADSGHICEDGREIMRPGGQFRALADYSLDPSRDDYYGHSGSWLDIQDSAWLQRLDSPDFPLVVTSVGGSAEDTVVSDLPGIACPPACTTALESGTPAHLEATASSADRRFIGWRGACTGSADSCDVVLDGEKRVEAVFGPSSYRVGVRVVGRGRVTTTGFTCANRCADRFGADDTVVFRARPTAGWRFAGWSGACRGRTVCRVVVKADRSVVATFRRRSS